MAEFSLPPIPRCARTAAYSRHRRAPRTFASSRCYVSTPTSARPAPRQLRSRHGRLRSDGVGRPDQDQERDRFHVELPALVPRRICGSCAMNIDGKNALACVSACADVKHDIKIYPLPHMPVIKDLIPDLTNFYAQYASIKPWLQTRTPPPPDGERLQSKEDQEKSTGLRHAFSAPAAPPAAPAIGGTAIDTSARRAAGGLPLDRRQPRRGGRRAPRLSRGSVPAVPVPYHHELHRGMPEKTSIPPRPSAKSSK